jgi:hypothetical protein
VLILVIKELTELEYLKLSLEYSISENHKNSLIRRIAEMEGKPVEEKKLDRTKKANVTQESFL